MNLDRFFLLLQSKSFFLSKSFLRVVSIWMLDFLLTIQYIKIVFEEFSRNCLKSRQMLQFDYSPVQHTLTIPKIFLSNFCKPIGLFWITYFLADHVTQLFWKKCIFARFFIVKSAVCSQIYQLKLNRTEFFSVSKIV